MTQPRVEEQLRLLLPRLGLALDKLVMNETSGEVVIFATMTQPVGKPKPPPTRGVVHDAPETGPFDAGQLEDVDPAEVFRRERSTAVPAEERLGRGVPQISPERLAATGISSPTAPSEPTGDIAAQVQQIQRFIVHDEPPVGGPDPLEAFRT